VAEKNATKQRGAGVGDTVVYAAHGIGTIVARGQNCVAGTERECVVVEFAAGLRVTLSLDDAASRLRPVADRAEFERVGAILATTCGGRESSWTRRVRESQAKLTSGRTRDLAEIVRDGAGRVHSVSAERLSDGERRVYLKARELLVRELCTTLRVGDDEANGWIDGHIQPLQGSES